MRKVTIFIIALALAGLVFHTCYEIGTAMLENANHVTPHDLAGRVIYSALISLASGGFATTIFDEILPKKIFGKKW
jgi:hypothetical protein